MIQTEAAERLEEHESALTFRPGHPLPSPRSVSAMRSASTWLPWAGKGLVAVLDQATLSMVGFALNLVLARSIAPAHYGAFSLAFSVFVLLSGLHNSFLLEPMSVIGARTHAQRSGWYWENLWRMHAVLTVPVAVVVAAGGLAGLLTSGRDVAAALIAMSVAMPFVLLFFVVRRFQYLRADPAGAWVVTAAYAVSVMGGLALLAVTGWISPVAAFLLSGWGSLTAIAAGTRGMKTGLPHLRTVWPERSLCRQHWEYGRWIFAASLVYWLSTEAYYAFTATFLGLEETGALRALMTLTSPAVQIITAVSTLVLPWASGAMAAGDQSRVRRVLSTVSLLTMGAAAAYLGLLVWFRVPVIRMVYGGRYLDHAWLLPYLAAIPVVVALASGSQILVRALQRPQAILVAYGASAALSCSAGVLLTAWWGLLGAALGLVASFLLYLCVLSWWARERSVAT